jgi:alkylhydroperoxidase family enzyme
MLKWLVQAKLKAFEREFDYDMSYARAILAADTRAFWSFSKVMGLARYRRDVPADVYYAVKLVGTLTEDCGPCTQLTVAMALREKVAQEIVAAVLGGDDAALTEPVRLAVQFARAVLAHDPAAEPLREEIVRRFGERGLVSLAFALTAARLFPTVKFALGHGLSCQRVLVAGQPVQVARAAA